MKSRTIVYIIPGFKERPSGKNYNYIKKEFRSRGFVVYPVIIDWNRKCMTDYVNQFRDLYDRSRKNSHQDVILFGFSFGAILAFIAATHIRPKLLLLCSFSPYFSEDIPLLKPRWKVYIGKKRILDFQRNYSFNSLSKKVTAPMIFLAGSEEISLLKKRVAQCSTLPNTKTYMIPRAKHNISEKNYKNKIIELIRKL